MRLEYLWMNCYSLARGIRVDSPAPAGGVKNQTAPGNAKTATMEKSRFCSRSTATILSLCPRLA